MFNAIKYGFYTIDPDYLEYLHNINSEVYYSKSYRDKIKPFVGIVVGINEKNYFIPISSAKKKHRSWKNVSKEHFLIYEIVDKDENIKGKIYKPYTDTQKIKLISILDIKKMIPVPDGCFSKIDFKTIKNPMYRNLMKKEYYFCLSIKNKVLAKAERIYREQKATGIVKPRYCNFTKLEQHMSKWKK